MYKVKQKLKWCKHRFIKWRKEQKENAKEEIDMIQKNGDHAKKGRTENLGEIEATEIPL